MKILVVDETAKVFSLECESTDTIAHLKAKWKKITSELMFDGKQLGNNLSDNMTLADVGIQDGSLILESHTDEYYSCGDSRRPRRIPEKDYLHYADAFKSGWREEHAKALLHLLLELCQDGTISEGNMTDETWIRIQNSLKNSMKCSFQIDFLKERLRDYKQLYSVLAETTSSSIFEWDRERKIITIRSIGWREVYYWREEYPELLLLCGPYISYFDTLEEVCLLLNTTQSSEQRVSETSTNINNAREASSSRGGICIRHPSGSNLSLMGSFTSIRKENRYLPSTMKIFVVPWTAKVFTLECESIDTIAHLRATLRKIAVQLVIELSESKVMFDGEQLGGEFSENMTLANVGIQDGSLILYSSRLLLGSSGGLERPPRPQKDYLCYADAFKSGWREEHAKALLHFLLELCQDGTIPEGNLTDEAWLRIQNSLNNSMKCSFQIDFLKERLRDYKQLYSVLTETRSWIFKWDRERKTITITGSRWREEFPVLLLLCGPHIPYFDTLEKVCLLLNTGQSSEQRVSESSTNKSTMHGKRVRQVIPGHSKIRRLFGKSQRS